MRNYSIKFAAVGCINLIKKKSNLLLAMFSLMAKS